MSLFALFHSSLTTDCNVSQSTFLRKGFRESQSSAHTLLYSHDEDKNSDKDDDDGGSESDGVSSLSSGSDSSHSSGAFFSCMHKLLK